MVKNNKTGLFGLKIFQRRLSTFICLGLALVTLVACGDATSTNLPPTAASTSTVAAPTTLAPTTAAAPTNTVAPTSGFTVGGTTPVETGGTTTPGGSSVSGIPDEIKKPFALISTDLEKRSSLPASSFQVSGYSVETFPDSALGCPDPTKMYTQVLTPGYKIQVMAGGKSYDYRANLQGTRVLLCGATGKPEPAP